MTLKRGRKGNLELEVMSLIEMALPDPDAQKLLHERSSEAASAISEAVHESLGKESRLYGWLTQYAFEAVVVALGAVRLIKTEDSGMFYFDDAYGELQPPDFRIVLMDGTQLLVEVKNVPPTDIETKVSTKSVSAAQAYATTTGARLLYAHYWSRLGIWTLVDPSALKDANGQRRLTLPEALKANEMRLLGDAMLGSRPPLTLSLVMDTETERLLENDGAGTELRRTAIRAVEMFSAGRVITDRVEQRLAWFLLLCGGWKVTEEYDLGDDGRVARVNIIGTPNYLDDESAKRVAEQGFAFLGALSTLYTVQFLDATTTDEGKVMALREEPVPGLLAQLIPHDYWTVGDRALSLWMLIVDPSATM